MVFTFEFYEPVGVVYPTAFTCNMKLRSDCVRMFCHISPLKSYCGAVTRTAVYVFILLLRLYAI